MSLLNYTTKIDADKSAAEISKALRRIGAQSVLTDYDPSGEFITALSFRLNLNGQDVSFRLPCDWVPVLEILKNDKKVPRAKCTQEQAVKVAWRIVKDWVEAQAAIIETKMVSTVEVFLPYAVMRDGGTLFEQVQRQPGMLLGDGS
jgi:hypothetical protein